MALFQRRVSYLIIMPSINSLTILRSSGSSREAKKGSKKGSDPFLDPFLLPLPLGEMVWTPPSYNRHLCAKLETLNFPVNQKRGVRDGC